MDGAFVALESTTNSFVVVIGLDSQYTLHKPLGDCLNCLIRKGKWTEAPISRFPVRVAYVYLPISPIGVVDSTERGRARGNTFWRVTSSLVQSVFYVIYDE